MSDEQKKLIDDERDEYFGAHPDRYRELLKPRTADEANEAFDRFQLAVAKARVECGIPEVYVVVSVPVLYETAGASNVITCFSFGSSAMTESLAAWAFGHEQARRQENIAHVIDQACKAVKRGRRTKAGTAD